MKRLISKSLVLSLALAAFMASGFAGSAKADAWREHEVRMHHWHRVHPVVVPGYVAAPPVIVAAPPPPPFGINLVVPLNIH